MPLYVATYTYPADLADRREENKPAHRQWLSEQVEAGRVLSAGPFTDGSGAHLVVSADDEGAARELLGQDPHSTEGLISEIELREWLPVFGRLAG